MKMLRLELLMLQSILPHVSSLHALSQTTAG